MRILDYVSQQYQLFPILAECYALHFASRKLSVLYDEIQKDLANFDLTSLPEFHALSSGVKAYTTW
jgi:hypothetical protein